MSKNVSGLSAVLLIIGSLVLLPGCSVQRLKDERNALYRQNQELQDHLSKARASLQGAQSEQNKLLSQVDTLETQLQQAQQATTSQQSTEQPIAKLPETTLGMADFKRIDGVEAEATTEKITVRIEGDILFSAGKAKLRGSAIRTLDRVAKVLKKNYASNQIRVEGYTDTDPIKRSKWQDNLDLSLARAAAVHRALQKSGIAPAHLQAVGLGQWHPRSNKKTSRRVEIVVVR